MKSENGYNGFRARLEHLLADEEPFKFAKRVGIAPATFDRIWNGGKIPRPELAQRIAEATSVSLDWLIAGVGEPGRTATAATGAYADEDLLSQVGEMIAKVHQEMGVRLPQAQLFRLTARRHNEIMGAAESDAERSAMLKLVEMQIRSELKAAELKPGTGKRSA